ncbi:transposase IS4 family protein [Herbaspirillum rubrisubalbicans M1]|uniref:IS1182 family transposase n=1 Tax=Herbaspirillum rubrisubalbicans TaxID=80842 RepID=UPI00073A196A|nr:IS1182 family transposase [Herbaspirillum rubrisubalbicans]ALU87824.1 transposase IS4 family protein [Herbaspirillum rubrisubalbicans M1]ALU88057.1 transposase IS4 family protein [Herbaspirillum rubrisubalbicans M1]ALU89031.1 transposase [Herbaspirillum rubrisubalbicans M1]ALU89177.1 transposase, IS4 family [Herbaspirillum rubrisubalbicans M1]ALU89768.1 transposase [Herbaspirillum rubrisubalbicans M1]
MLKKPTAAQHELEMVTIEMLVPKDHLLRKIDAAVDFEFIREKVAHLYCADNGRPALDPVVLFKLLFIGYLFGIRSERQLIREVQVNVAYRWFAGFRLTDKVPDSSTFSQNRRRRFIDTTVYQEIFDEIVRQAIGRGMVDGRVLYSDSTHLKANANKNKFDYVQVTQTPSAYLAELDAAVDIDRAEHGKKPLKRDDDDEPPTKEIKVSRTDPESGYMVRDDKPKGFFYLDHRTVDAKHSIITDTHVTPASVHDSQPYLARLDRQRQTFGFDVQAVGLDAGYFTPAVCQGLENREISGVMGYRTPNHKPGTFFKRAYEYDAYRDEYICPQGQPLRYSTTNRLGYREYKSNPEQCRGCKVREQCTNSANAVKVVTRHVWERSKEKVDDRRRTEWGKRIYARRKETVERSFADAKQLHGHRYARMRGLRKVAEQCLLAAAAQNMKKIALLVARLRALLHGLSASASVQKWLQRKIRALLGFCAIDHLQITCA